MKRELRLDIDKLRSGMYTLHELVETNERPMGAYEDKDCVLKMGKFGMHLMWGDNTINLSQDSKTIDNMTFEDVVEKIKEKQDKINLPTCCEN